MEHCAHYRNGFHVLGSNSFNQDFSKWDTSSAVDMSNMFGNATSFNQNIGMWDTHSVQTMKDMFHGATSFNQDISNWNMVQVTDMAGMLFGAKSFDQDLCSWLSNIPSCDLLVCSIGAFSNTSCPSEVPSDNAFCHFCG